MRVKAWIKMGCEKREVTFEVTDAEIERVGDDALEMYIEDIVQDWISCRYGWGWSCDLMTNDFSLMEDSEDGANVITGEVLNPATKRIIVPT